MSELQSGETYDYEEVVEEVEETTETAETDEQGDTENPDPEQGEESDLATEGEQEHETKPETSQNENVQKVINRKHAEKMEAERRADAAEARLREFESKQQQYEPELPELSDFPDSDEVADYNQKLRARIKWETEQSYNQQEGQRRQQEADTTRQAEFSKKGEAYTERAKSLGVSSKELQAAGQTVASYNLSEDIVMGILDDKEGALITTYLANNPLDIENLKALSPYKAALYMETTIRPKLAARKPKTTNAPKPAMRVEGKATDPERGKYKYSEGATFE
jgi:hypothetical protein